MTSEALSLTPQAFRRPLRAVTEADTHAVVVLATSKDPDGKATLLLLDRSGQGRDLVVKVPSTDGGQAAVEREIGILEELTVRRLAVGMTIPRLQEIVDAGGRTAFVSALLPGRSMAARYHAWRHTRRPRAVAADFSMAQRWITRLQATPTGPPRSVSVLAELVPLLQERWPEVRADQALTRHLDAAALRLAACRTPRTVVHGDFWFGNVLVSGASVSGVVDWECGEVAGEPLRDVARFAVSYSLYLDRHTRPGHQVSGHPGLRAREWGDGLRYALQGQGWFPDLVRGFLCANLSRLGARPDLWFDLAIAGVAEVAVRANHPDFAARHLQLLRDVIARGER